MMDQLNIVLSETQQETQPIAMTSLKGIESPLLHKVRQKFEITGVISLLFGGLFTFSFYQAGIGVNVLFFTMIMVTLLLVAMSKFEMPLKTGTKVYYTAAILFGLSTALTASDTLQMLNLLAILFLLNLSLLHQFQESSGWDFIKHVAKMFGMVIMGIASIGMPFVDGVNFLKRLKVFKNEKVRNIFLGIIISIPLLWVIVSLLSGADMLFGDMTKGFFDFFLSFDVIGVAFMLLFGFLSCYCILCGAAAQADRQGKKAFIKADASIAVTILVLICLVYALFCGLQIVYLFANGLFTLPDGYTFAEYARRGFFELLAVTVLNLLLMLLCTTLFEDSKLVRILLTFVTACTYILIISATYRMLLYIGSYHLTFLRLFVLLSLLIIAIVLAGVIVSVYRKTFPLFRYTIVVISVCYLVFSFMKPDYWIAQYHTSQIAILSSEDAAYLTLDLSFDAAPVVLPLLSMENRWSEEANPIGDWRAIDDYHKSYYERIDRQEADRGIRDYNLSNALATRYTQEYPKND